MLNRVSHTRYYLSTEFDELGCFSSKMPICHALQPRRRTAGPWLASTFVEKHVDAEKRLVGVGNQSDPQPSCLSPLVHSPPSVKGKSPESRSNV